MKPRIKPVMIKVGNGCYTLFGYMEPFLISGYLCEGMGESAHGYTMHDAYKNWRSLLIESYNRGQSAHASLNVPANIDGD